MTAPLKARKKIILLKVEETYGTDAAPSPAADAMLVANVEFTPFASNNIEREVVQAHLGSRGQLVTSPHVSLSFDIELAGAGGAVDAVPAYAPALRASAHQQVVNEGSNCQFKPVDSGEESATIYFHMDGQKHALVGARGNRDIRLSANGIPYFHFEFMGLYVTPVSVADPSPSLSGFQLPKTVNNSHTPTFSLHGFNGKLLELTMSQGNTVEYFNLPGEESVQVTDRQSTGSMTIEAPPLGTQDFFTAVKNENLAALQIVHGVGEGQVVQIDAPRVQLLNPNYGEQNSRVTLSMELGFIPTDAGSDEWVITTR